MMCKNIWIYIALKFLMGTMASFGYTAAFLLVGEMSGPKYDLALSLMYQSSSDFRPVPNQDKTRVLEVLSCIVLSASLENSLVTCQTRVDKQKYDQDLVNLTSACQQGDKRLSPT